MNEVITPVEDARFEAVEIIEDGKAIGILLKEVDGTISAIRIAVDQIAD